jgi:uncharacterized lipoprotein YmbA
MRWLAVVSLLCLAGCSSLPPSSARGIAYGQQQRVKVGAWIGAAAGVALAVVLMGDSGDTDCPAEGCAAEASPPP